MIEVNEYFDGKVKSFPVNNEEGKKTVGLMQQGEYEFDTSSKETITVISGEMSVYLEEYQEWEDFGPGSSFDIPANSKFKVRTQQDTAYVCTYN